jgi:hypothetical protein
MREPVRRPRTIHRKRRHRVEEFHDAVLSSPDLRLTPGQSPVRPPIAIRLSSSAGSATAADALRPVGPYRLGTLTGLSGSYGRVGESGPYRRLLDTPLALGA